MPPSSLSHRDYYIGRICAVEPERVAVVTMLDEKYSDKLPAVGGDSNSYTFGTIGKHKVVITSLPSGTYETNAAALVASQMMRSFQDLRFRLLVGIGGGVPRFTGDDPADIRLGDVVVSEPTYHTGGVIQYDLGKTNEGEQQPKRIGTLNKPPVFIRTAVASLKANHNFKDYPLADHLARMTYQHSRLVPEYTHQGDDNDLLFEAGYKHKGQSTVCVDCHKIRGVSRPRRQLFHPQPGGAGSQGRHQPIHYGTIASGNQVVKDRVIRDYWRDTEGVLCFEMEAAGLMDSFPCLVIRCVCDYADSHKNVRWQPYAAATAAAYAKDLVLKKAPTAVRAIDSSLGEQLESSA